MIERQNLSKKIQEVGAKITSINNFYKKILVKEVVRPIFTNSNKSSKIDRIEFEKSPMTNALQKLSIAQNLINEVVSMTVVNQDEVIKK